MKPIRQGDVWLYPITDDEFDVFDDGGPDNAGESSVELVLAEGEATGHHHRLRAGGTVPTLLVRRGTRRMVRVHGPKPASLTHEEHSTLTVPPGAYEVRIQREYDPGNKAHQRAVVD